MVAFVILTLILVCDCYFSLHPDEFLIYFTQFTGSSSPYFPFMLLSAGVFSYLSYRDPNLLKTLDVYDATANFLRELELDNDTLTKAIIGTIGDVDSYQLPDAKGYSR